MHCLLRATSRRQNQHLAVYVMVFLSVFGVPGKGVNWGGMDCFRCFWAGVLMPPARVTGQFGGVAANSQQVKRVTNG
jgi:hypothetical protein